MREQIRQWMIGWLLAVLAISGAKAQTNPVEVVIEAEQPVDDNLERCFKYGPRNAEEAAVLSEKGWLQSDRRFSDRKRYAHYKVDVPRNGSYRLWVRGWDTDNAFRWRFDEQPWQILDADVKPVHTVPLRGWWITVSWRLAGQVAMEQGQRTLQVEWLETGTNTVVALDCFLLTDGDFKPDAEQSVTQQTAAPHGWFAWPLSTGVAPDSPIYLRDLNQPQAGEEGCIRAMNEVYAYLTSKRPVRLWGVQVYPATLMTSNERLDALAERLAGHGVNSVRYVGQVHDVTAPNLVSLDKKLCDRLHYFMAALKKRGIYTRLAMFDPAWITAQNLKAIPDAPVAGTAPGRLLPFFHKSMKNAQRRLFQHFLSATNAYTGLTTAQDPALACVEITVNDSLFAPHFKPGETLTGEPLRYLEERFAVWCARKYGSLQKALDTWGPPAATWPADQPDQGLLTLLPTSAFGPKAFAGLHPPGLRHFDQVEYLVGVQRDYFTSMLRLLRQTGYRGAVCAVAGNNAAYPWLEPLDMYTRMAADTLDLHGTVTHDIEQPAATPMPRHVTMPGRPYTLSDLGPGAGLFASDMLFLPTVYAALAGAEAMFLHGWREPLRETVGAPYNPPVCPVWLGAFPALSLMFRQGSVSEGAEMHHFNLDLKQACQLHDVNATGEMVRGPAALDPFDFLAGKVTWSFSRNIDESAHTPVDTGLQQQSGIIRSVSREVVWNYGQGYATVNSQKAQGAVGNLAQASLLQMGHIDIVCSAERAAILVVSMDDKPLSSSDKVLVQVLGPRRYFDDYGVCMRNVEGTITFKRQLVGKLQAQALDIEGRPLGKPVRGVDERLPIELQPAAPYWVIQESDGSAP